MSNPWVVLTVTIILIATSALFVAVEFALIAARQHRLEDAAATSRSARAAVRSTKELSVLLAGSQLGITVCTLSLGATTKPAVHYWLTPMIHSWGAPMRLADATGFLLALMIVTFMHLVLGEMAPKSWAIAHPERSATMLAIPMRAFMAITRPLLVALNQVANWCVRKVGVAPVNEVDDAQDPKALRQLIEHSATAGTLDERYRANLIRALDLDGLSVGEVASRNASPVTVPSHASPADIQAQARMTGHLRLFVRGDDDTIAGVVRVRNSLQAPPHATARDLLQPVLTLTAQTPVYQALHLMRQTRNHVALVTTNGELTGLITLTDVLKRLLPATGVAG